MPVGTCALCRQEADLQDSHLIPKAMYSLFRSPGEDSKDPIFVSEGNSFNTSRQVKGHLLCRTCETRFSACGEQWVLANCRRSETDFPILDALNATTPLYDGPDPVVYAGRNVPGIDLDAIMYFGVSVFWRAAVRSWTMDKRRSLRLDLGPYEEQLRAFLAGDVPFPEDAVLLVSVSRNAGVRANEFMTFPFRTKREATHTKYKLVVPGISYQLILGRAIPTGVRQSCTLASEAGFLFQSESLEERTVLDMARLALGPGARRRQT